MIEHDADFLDMLVNAFAARAEGTGIQDMQLRARLANQINSAKGQPLTFDYLTTITGAESSPKELTDRKIAWLLQHALPAKCYCVNTKIATIGTSKASSHLVTQMEMLGFQGQSSRTRAIYEEARSRAPKMHTTVDALLLSDDRRTLYVVKGCSFSAIAGERVRYEGALTETLWARKLITNPVVDSAACRGLIAAYGILKDKFPQLEVVPLFCIVDDVDAGWHFQAHDLSGTCWKTFEKPYTSIAGLPIRTSSLNFLRELKADSDFFNAIPEWATEDPLRLLPPDRPVRSLMIVKALLGHQVEHSTEVVPMSGARLAQEIARTYDFNYPKDMRRHDFLHLIRRSLISLHPRSTYVVTPLGLMKYYILLAMHNKNLPNDFAENVLDKLTRQSRFVWKLCGLT
jgi:hypothetical protein